MSEISLKRFVDIDIKSSVTRTISGTRDTIILFTADGQQGLTRTITSLNEAQEQYEQNPTTLAYLEMFFNCGGAKCKVVEGVDFADITTDDLKALGNEFIIITYAGAAGDLSSVYTKLKTLATSLNQDSTVYGVNEKILVARTETLTDDESVKNFAVKYSEVLAAEMSIAAYLSQINIYKADSVHDYMFTEESITPEDLSDTDYATLIENNMNVDIKLVNAVRNLGGNLKNGDELTNAYVKIMLHQTLTDRLINLLVQKLKNSSGVAQIYSAIAQELEAYRTAGYLTTDKIWTAEDLEIRYNQKTYTVIEKGTALLNGYVIKVLPLSSLTDADKAAHKAPPIYIVLADQYGIRQITINGEVL